MNMVALIVPCSVKVVAGVADQPCSKKCRKVRTKQSRLLGHPEAGLS